MGFEFTTHFCPLPDVDATRAQPASEVYYMFQKNEEEAKKRAEQEKIELAEYEEKLKKEKADGEVPTKDESTPGEGARDRVAKRKKNNWLW